MNSGYVIYGKHGCRPSEEIDETDSIVEAERLVTEYEMAFGRGWEIWFQPFGEKVEDQCRI